GPGLQRRLPALRPQPGHRRAARHRDPPAARRAGGRPRPRPSLRRHPPGPSGPPVTAAEPAGIGAFEIIEPGVVWMDSGHRAEPATAGAITVIRAAEAGIGADLSRRLLSLLQACFPGCPGRSYFKLPPHFRYVAMTGNGGM